MTNNNGEVPNWILNKREYNAKRRASLKLTKMGAEVDMETFGDMESFIKNKGWTKKQFIKECFYAMKKNR